MDQKQALKNLTYVSRIVFGFLSLFMMLLAVGLVIYAGVRLGSVFTAPDRAIGTTLLDSIGYTIIAIAVFEVSKFIFEEEVFRPTEMRHAGEARRSLTKFISTIAIAIFLEALVAIFRTSKEMSLDQMLYPTLLLFAGVSLVVGLGIFQRFSAEAEMAARGAPGEPEDAEDLRHEGAEDEAHPAEEGQEAEKLERREDDARSS